MKKKTKIIIGVLMSVILLVGLLGYGIHWAFFDIQRLSGQEVIVVSDSPDGQYTVTAYRNNGGATTGYAVLATVVDNDNQRSRNFYWQDNCEEASIIWVDETTVEINGVSLNVWKDTHDYRRK